MRAYTLEYMSQFNSNMIYVKNIPFPAHLIETFNNEMASYGLSSALNFLCFKRKNHFTKTLKLHIDYCSKTNDVVHSSIILPLSGCEETVMYWFDGKYDLLPKEETNFGSSYAIPLWRNMPTERYSVEIASEPVLTRVDVPHSVTSRTDGSYRTILSVRLVGNPKFDDIIKKLS